MRSDALCVHRKQPTAMDFRYRGKKRKFVPGNLHYSRAMSSIAIGGFRDTDKEGYRMSKAEDNKAIVGRCFTRVLGKNLQSWRRR